MLPLISCLMVTRPAPERLPLLRLALADFQRQSYPRRELVVVLDQGDPGARDALLAELARLADPLMRVVEPPAGLTLGGLRNVSLEAARGDYACGWDDDDRSHPLRLQEQYGALQGTAVAVLLGHTLQFLQAERRLRWVVGQFERR